MQDCKVFQSTLPQGERRISIPLLFVSFVDFNPRSHKGSDAEAKGWKDSRAISIHAPTRGATTGIGGTVTLKGKFQSTLPQGERRRWVLSYRRNNRNFNPRSHKGSDHSDTITIFNFYISIHAPTRGATAVPWRYRPLDAYFNPRSHKGSDSTEPNPVLVLSDISIHAPTRGATVTGKENLEIIGISIHAPTRGATPGRRSFWQRLQDFNPRSHKGSDIVLGCRIEDLIISIHAPTRGATLQREARECIITDFNPRSHKGSDRGCRRRNGGNRYFNPRSHKGSDSNQQRYSAG